MTNTAEPMTARGAHYTALLEAIDRQGATKLHGREREQLLEAADALLFGEPESGGLLRAAEELVLADPAACELLEDQRRDPRSEQLHRAQHVSMRDGAHAHLRDVAVVT